MAYWKFGLMATYLFLECIIFISRILHFCKVYINFEVVPTEV